MKFILLFFTLYGNYAVFAQNELPLSDSTSPNRNKKITATQFGADSVALEKPTISLYPNPAENKVEIKIAGFKAGTVEILMWDNTGNVVRKETRQVFAGNENIVFMFLQKPGVYTLVLKQYRTIIKERLVIR